MFKVIEPHEDKFPKGQWFSRPRGGFYWSKLSEKSASELGLTGILYKKRGRYFTFIDGSREISYRHGVKYDR